MWKIQLRHLSINESCIYSYWIRFKENKNVYCPETITIIFTLFWNLTQCLPDLSVSFKMIKEKNSQVFKSLFQSECLMYSVSLSFDHIRTENIGKTSVRICFPCLITCNIPNKYFIKLQNDSYSTVTIHERKETVYLTYIELNIFFFLAL